METKERTQPVIRVVDVPDAASAVEVARLMNEPCNEANYLLVNVLYMEPLHMTRAVYRLTAKEQQGKADVARGDDKEDARAADYLKEHLSLSDRTVEKDFKGLTGIDRSYKWF